MFSIQTLLLVTSVLVLTNAFTTTTRITPSVFHHSSNSNKSFTTTKLQSATLPPSDATENPVTTSVPPPINPSSEFGRPLPPKLEAFNRIAISFVKNVVFDSMFAVSSSSDKSEIMTRSYARFYALETIARMPYFAYLSVLHLYETLGLWRRSDYMKVHFCESWNELHHLLIMESLGGSAQYKDRFLAQHAAFAYYWFVIACYIANPTLAYNLNQAVEEHAFDTYDQFLKDFDYELKTMDAPSIAKEYYTGNDMYLFDEMHTCSNPTSTTSSTTIDDEDGVPRRRQKIDSLYDVFVAIRNDEAEHAKTMEYLQRQDSDIQICDV